MTTYREFYRRSIDARESFWAEQAGLVHWHKPHTQVLDYRRPPFAGGSSAEKPTSATTRSIGTWRRAAIRGRSSMFPRKRARTGASATASFTSKSSARRP